MSRRWGSDRRRWSGCAFSLASFELRLDLWRSNTLSPSGINAGRMIVAQGTLAQEPQVQIERPGGRPEPRDHRPEPGTAARHARSLGARPDAARAGRAGARGRLRGGYPGAA